MTRIAMKELLFVLPLPLFFLPTSEFLARRPIQLFREGNHTIQAPARGGLRVSEASRERYEVSFRAGEIDSSGNTLCGNNLMKLVPFHGKLYASTAVECDKTLDPHAFKTRAMIAASPAPQILVLDGSKSRWHLEKEFGRNAEGTARFKRVNDLMAVKFETDGQGVPLKQPAEMLIASLAPFGLQGTCAIYTALYTGAALEWADTQFHRCSGQSGRAFGFFRDPATKVDRVFVGTQTGHGGEIYSGVFDSAAPGRIRWDSVPEGSEYRRRLMVFTVFDNRFFGAGETEVLERTSRVAANGPVASWKIVYEYSGPTHLPLISSNSGLRGLTPIPAHANENSMLAVMEGRPGDVILFQLTPDRLQARHEAAIASLFSSFRIDGNDMGGRRRVEYYIGAFNNIPTIRDPASGEAFSLIGLEQYNHIVGHERSAWFVSRNDAARYALHEVRELPLRPGDKPLNPDLGLRAVRTFVVSPFPEDEGGVLFMGGFDPLYECGQTPKAEHLYTLSDNGWIYRVGIHTALAH